jgi:ATP-dependent Clp protease adapter protein ClpS
MHSFQDVENLAAVHSEGRISSRRSTGYRNRDLEIYCYTSRRFEPIRVPGNQEESDSQDEELYEVRIIDNDHNTYGEVIQITVLALGISEDKAFGVAWEVDHHGSCVVAHAAKEPAEELAGIIRLIGIEVQVNPLSGRMR